MLACVPGGIPNGGVFEGGPGRGLSRLDTRDATTLTRAGNRVLFADGRKIFSYKNLAALLPVVWQSWLESHFTAEQLTDQTVTAELADPDGDNIPNVIEYMTPSDPNAKTAGDILTVLPPSGAQGVRFQWQQDTGRNDLRVSAQTSPDLSLWDEAAVKAVSGNAGGIRTMEATAGAGQEKVYFRLKVERVQ